MRTNENLCAGSLLFRSSVFLKQLIRTLRALSNRFHFISSQLRFFSVQRRFLLVSIHHARRNATISSVFTKK